MKAVNQDDPLAYFLKRRISNNEVALKNSTKNYERQKCQLESVIIADRNDLLKKLIPEFTDAHREWALSSAAAYFIEQEKHGYRISILDGWWSGYRPEMNGYSLRKAADELVNAMLCYRGLNGEAHDDSALESMTNYTCHKNVKGIIDWMASQHRIVCYFSEVQIIDNGKSLKFRDFSNGSTGKTMFDVLEGFIGKKESKRNSARKTQ